VNFDSLSIMTMMIEYPCDNRSVVMKSIQMVSQTWKGIGDGEGQQGASSRPFLADTQCKIEHIVCSASAYESQ